MTELFPAASVTSFSPRETWLMQHGLVLQKLPSGRWEVAFDEHNRATGSNPERAMARYCEKHRMPLPAFLSPP